MKLQPSWSIIHTCTSSLITTPSQPCNPAKQSHATEYMTACTPAPARNSGTGWSTPLTQASSTTLTGTQVAKSRRRTSITSPTAPSSSTSRITTATIAAVAALTYTATTRRWMCSWMARNCSFLSGKRARKKRGATSHHQIWNRQGIL